MSLYETGVRQIIDDYLIEKSKQRRDYKEYWSASSAGYCMRRVIFDRMGVPEVKPDARKYRIFEAGHIFHSWIQGLTKEAGISIEQETEVIDDQLKIKGHFDDLIRIDLNEGGEPVQYGEESRKTIKILYDYKTVSSRSFKYGDEISHYHRMQLGTYLYLLKGEVKEARILKISKDDLRMKEQQLMWTPDLEKQVVAYWSTLNGYWDVRRLPNCTCDKYDGGFLADPRFNPYYYDGEPCSIKWYNEWKKNKDKNG